MLQGNSDNLATINVGAGYVGVEHQNMALVSILVFVHTLTFPILAVLLLWLGQARQQQTMSLRLVHNYYFFSSSHI